MYHPIFRQLANSPEATLENWKNGWYLSLHSSRTSYVVWRQINGPNLSSVLCECTLRGCYMSKRGLFLHTLAGDILTCRIQSANTQVLCEGSADSSPKNNIWLIRAVPTRYTTVHCSLLIIWGWLGGKPWLFTQKVLYGAERVTSDWPAH